MLLTCCIKNIYLISPLGNDPAFLANVRRAVEEALLRAVRSQRYQTISGSPSPFSCPASLSKEPRMCNHLQSYVERLVRP